MCRRHCCCRNITCPRGLLCDGSVWTGFVVPLCIFPIGGGILCSYHRWCHLSCRTRAFERPSIDCVLHSVGDEFGGGALVFVYL